MNLILKHSLTITALLNQLQRPIVTHDIMLEARLPLEEVTQSMYSNEQENPSATTFPNCSYVVRFASEAIFQLAMIQSLLADVSTAAASSYDPTPAFHDYVAWLLDAFLSAHEQRKKIQNQISLRESCRKSDLACFSSLHTLLTKSKACLRSSILQKGYIILSTLCADLIASIEDIDEQTMQLKVCSCLLNLSAMCQTNDSLKRAVSLALVPSIQSINEDRSRWSGLGKDFQVR